MNKIKKWVDAHAQKTGNVQAPESSTRWLGQGGDTPNWMQGAFALDAAVMVLAMTEHAPGPGHHNSQGPAAPAVLAKVRWGACATLLFSVLPAECCALGMEVLQSKT